jgi:flagellar hook-associated protein 1 FlgK
MSDLLINSAAGMNVYRRALEVTGNNISNVTTEGYTRTQIKISENAPNFSGGTGVGQGATAVDVVRNYHNFVGEQLQKSTTALGRFTTIQTFSTQLNQLFSQGNSLLKSGIDQYLAGWNTFANDPTTNSSKSSLLANHNQLTTMIDITNSTMSKLNEEINNKITDTTDKVNSLAQKLVDTNIALGKTSVDTVHVRNDLLDQRDQLMKEMNLLVDAQMFERSNGIIDVYAGNQKVPLITDNRVVGLQIEPNAYSLNNLQRNPQLDVWIQHPGTNQMVNVSQQLLGGELAGLISFRTQQLNRAQDDMGLAVTGMMIATNELHRQGIDAQGYAGLDVFSGNGNTDTLNAYVATEQAVYRNSQNKGNAALTANLYGAQPPLPAPSSYISTPDVGALRARSYILEYDEKYAGGFRISDHRTGENITATGDGSIISPLQFEGLEVVVSDGLPHTGDRFELRFGSQTLEQFTQVLTDPNAIAYRLPGTGIGNNSIAANIAGISNRQILVNGTETPGSWLHQAAVNVGMAHASNTSGLDAQQALQKQIEAEKDASAGVNMDEEAQNLIRYQQSYQAATNVMQASRKIFDLLRSIM